MKPIVQKRVKEGMEDEDIAKELEKGYDIIAQQQANKMINLALTGEETKVDFKDILIKDGEGPGFFDDAEGLEKALANLENQSGRTQTWTGSDYSVEVPTADGADIKLVDFMEPNLMISLQRYARSMAGLSALARQGIRNFDEIDTWVKAAQSEQRKLGEKPINELKLRALFSHFKGTPIQGVMGNRVNEGISETVALAKRLTNLGFLAKLGIPQAAETGAQVAAIGFKQTFRHGIKPLFSKAARNPELKRDFAYMIGELGKDHKVLLEHAMIDEVSSSDQRTFLQEANRVAGALQYVQGYTSMFFQIRGWQHNMLLSGFSDNFFHRLKHNKFSEAEVFRLENDLGITPDIMQKLKNLVDQGVVEFDQRNGVEYLNRLNPDKWDLETLDQFTGVLSRVKNQSVMKPLPGEQDPWMFTEVGSLVTHLKVFPILSFQKQFLRNIKFQDPQTLTLALAGFGTTVTALGVKDLIDGKYAESDSYYEDLVRRSIAYSNMTSFLPMATDPIMTMLGLDSMRISPYGGNEVFDIPVLDYAQQVSKAPAATMNIATGQAGFKDYQSIGALPFMRSYGLARLFNDKEAEYRE